MSYEERRVVTDEPADTVRTEPTTVVLLVVALWALHVYAHLF